MQNIGRLLVEGVRIDVILGAEGGVHYALLQTQVNLTEADRRRAEAQSVIYGYGRLRRHRADLHTLEILHGTQRLFAANDGHLTNPVVGNRGNSGGVQELLLPLRP